MKRTTAREIAVQLGFYASASDKPVSEIIDEFLMRSTLPHWLARMSFSPNIRKKAEGLHHSSCGEYGSVPHTDR